MKDTYIRTYNFNLHKEQQPDGKTLLLPELTVAFQIRKELAETVVSANDVEFPQHVDKNTVIPHLIDVLSEKIAENYIPHISTLVSDLPNDSTRGFKKVFKLYTEIATEEEKTIFKAREELLVNVLTEAQESNGILKKELELLTIENETLSSNLEYIKDSTNTFFKRLKLLFIPFKLNGE